MESFVIIISGWKTLTIITKRSILDVAAVLDPLLRVFLLFSFERSHAWTNNRTRYIESEEEKKIKTIKSWDYWLYTIETLQPLNHWGNQWKIKVKYLHIMKLCEVEKGFDLVFLLLLYFDHWARTGTAPLLCILSL